MKKSLLILLFAVVSVSGYAKVEEYLIYRTYYTSPGQVLDGGISADSRLVVAIDKRHTIRIWRYQNGRLIKTIKTGPHRASIGIIHPAKAHFYTGGRNNDINIWDLRKGSLIRTLSGHKGAVNSLAISNDGETLVSGGKDGNIFVWKLDRYKIKY